MNLKVQWQWPAAIVFAVVFVSLAVLTYTGKVPPTSLLALVAWLAPAPWKTQEPPPPQTSGQP